MSPDRPRNRRFEHILLGIHSYRKYFLAFLIILFAISTPAVTFAANLVITTTADKADGVCDNDCSLREAVQTASTNGEDDTIVFDPLIFSSKQTIVVTTEIAFTVDPSPSGGYTIRIIGPGRDLLTISGGGTTRIFNIQNNRGVYIRGITFASGFSVKGGAIYSSTIDLTIVDSAFEANKVEGLEPLLNGSFYGGAGGAIFASRLTIANSILRNNSAHGTAGIAGDLLLAGLGIGGAIRSTSPFSKVINCSFENNLAQGADGPLTEIARNGAAGYGGAIYAGTITIISSEFVANRAQGGIGASVTPTGVVAGRGGPAFGGGIRSSGARIRNSTFVGNVAKGGDSGTAPNPESYGDAYQSYGGAIYDAGNMKMVNSTLVENIVHPGSGRKGGDGGGGGIMVAGTDQQYGIANSTITGNVVLPGIGQTENGRSDGGGLYALNFGASGPQLTNSIVAENTAEAGPDLFGHFSFATYNWVGAGDANLFGITHGVAGNHVGSISEPLDPELDTLSVNGGITRSRMPLKGSPALNIGDNGVIDPSTQTPLLFDQRSLNRIDPVGGQIDLGSVEVGATSVPAPGMPDLQEASDSGPNRHDNLTNSRSPVIAVLDAHIGATVELLRNGKVIGEALALDEYTAINDTNPPMDGMVAYTMRQIVGESTSEIGSELKVIFDNTRPLVTINQASQQQDPTRSFPLLFDVEFSESAFCPSAQVVSLKDSTADVSSAAIFVSGQSATLCRISVHNVISNGQSVTAKLPENATIDEAGNTSLPSTSTDNTIVVDNVSPSVTIEQAEEQNDPAISLPVRFAVLFSENVSGFGPEDVSLSSSSADVSQAVVTVSGNGNTYQVDVGGVRSSGSIIANVTSGGAVDALGNPNEASTSKDNVVEFVLVTRAFDFDGDGKTDISIFRPSVGEWWYLRSSDGGNSAAQFGTSTDVITAADYTGDGKTDMAFFRPSTGEWYVIRSEDMTYYAFPFGSAGDIPAPADYDGDGKADAAVFRPSAGTWFILRSNDGGTTIANFGAPGDLPVAGDFDGDGKADIGVFRPNGTSGSEWWIMRSTDGLFATQFGQPGDKAVSGDYTGDGKSDIAFFTPSGQWFVLRSEDLTYYAFPFGVAGDLPVPGDYDGDGKQDAGVFRPSSATWFIQGSTSGTVITTFGVSGDRPVPNAFVR